MLAQCDGLVGMLNSQFFRVATYLNIYRHQAIPPLISMQGGFGLAIGPMGEATNPEFRL